MKKFILPLILTCFSTRMLANFYIYNIPNVTNPVISTALFSQNIDASEMYTTIYFTGQFSLQGAGGIPACATVILNMGSGSSIIVRVASGCLPSGMTGSVNLNLQWTLQQVGSDSFPVSVSVFPFGGGTISQASNMQLTVNTFNNT